MLKYGVNLLLHAMCMFGRSSNCRQIFGGGVLKVDFVLSGVCDLWQ